MRSFAVAPRTASPSAASGDAAPVAFATVQSIVTQRCAVCHAADPTQPGFASAPQGIMLDTPDAIVANA